MGARGAAVESIEGVGFVSEDPEGFRKRVETAGGMDAFLAQQGIDLRDPAYQNARCLVASVPGGKIITEPKRTG